MFCGKCGTKNDDDAMFCAECGAKINEGQVSESNTTVAAAPNNKNRKVGMIAVAVIVAIVIVAGFAMFGGRSYKATAEKFVNASMEADAEAIIDLMPDEVIDYIIDSEGYDDYDEMIDDLDEELQDTVDTLEKHLKKDLKDLKISTEILNIENITGDDLDDIKDDYEDMDCKVSAAKTLEVEITIESEETEISNSVDVGVIKIGRSWYLDFKNSL